MKKVLRCLELSAILLANMAIMVMDQSAGRTALQANTLVVLSALTLPMLALKASNPLFLMFLAWLK